MSKTSDGVRRIRFGREAAVALTGIVGALLGLPVKGAAFIDAYMWNAPLRLREARASG